MALVLLTEKSFNDILIRVIGARGEQVAIKMYDERLIEGLGEVRGASVHILHTNGTEDTLPGNLVRAVPVTNEDGLGPDCE